MILITHWIRITRDVRLISTVVGSGAIIGIKTKSAGASASQRGQGFASTSFFGRICFLWGYVLMLWSLWIGATGGWTFASGREIMAY